jgi:multisubunit Na+/H+ antiporter MnhG subunit
MLVACHPPDPVRRMHRSEIGVAVGLAGVALSSIALVADQKQEHVVVPIIIGFGTVTFASLGVYLAAAAAAN